MANVECASPVVLRSGLVVGCGKCPLCRSKQRNEWSVRLQLTAGLYSKMPFMVGLSYDNEHLVYGDDGPTLVRSHPHLFLKRLKDKFNLYNSLPFAYFGCGEYGGKYGRPHYHILMFGFDALEKAFNVSVHGAENMLKEVWQEGNVDVCRAEWSGVHYVTKYIMKDTDTNTYGDLLPSFTFCSRGIGKAWLDTFEARTLKRQINRARVDVQNALLDAASWEFGFNESSLRALKRVLDNVEPLMPELRVQLPSGKYAPLPRYYRKKMLGSFEHFKDNPFWQYNSLKQLYGQLKQDLVDKDYNLTHDLTLSEQRVIKKINKIVQLLNIKKSKNENVRSSSNQEAGC